MSKPSKEELELLSLVAFILFITVLFLGSAVYWVVEIVGGVL